MDHSESERLPIDPRTGEPLPPRAQPGYYPGYKTLSQQAFWDEATRKVVVRRVEQVPPIRFFTPEEARLLGAVLDRVLPQDDRDEAHRIPVLNFVDERLFMNRGDGYRFEQMPPDREAFRLGLQGIHAIALHRHGHPFVELGPTAQDEILKSLHDGKPDAVQDACEAYYAHPWAWDEIGFGGPAYPRGYMRLEGGQPEPWEKPEQRYAWAPPPSARSAQFEGVAGSLEHLAAPGQGGTH
jgi:hypothetical protein